MTGMIIRQFELRDLAGVKNLISEELHAKPHRFLALLAHLAYDLPFKLLGLDTIVGSIANTNNGNIIGVIIAKRFPLGKVWAIGPIVVNKPYRRAAIGKSMMELLLKILKDKKGKLAMVSLGYTERHSAARRFFTSFGFLHVKRVFTDRDQARHYVRMVTLKGSHNENLCQEHILETSVTVKTCYVLLKEL